MFAAVVRILLFLIAIGSVLFVKKAHVSHVLSHRSRISEENKESLEWLNRLAEGLLDAWCAVEAEAAEDAMATDGRTIGQPATEDPDNAIRGPHALSGDAKAKSPAESGVAAGSGRRNATASPDWLSYALGLLAPVGGLTARLLRFPPVEPFPVGCPQRSTVAAAAWVERTVERKLMELGVASNAKCRLPSLGSQLPKIRSVRVAYPGPIHPASGGPAALCGECAAPGEPRKRTPGGSPTSKLNKSCTCAAGAWRAGEADVATFDPRSIQAACQTIELECELEYNGVGVDWYLATDANLPQCRRLPVALRVTDVSLFAHVHLRATLRFDAVGDGANLEGGDAFGADPDSSMAPRAAQSPAHSPGSRPASLARRENSPLRGVVQPEGRDTSRCDSGGSLPRASDSKLPAEPSVAASPDVGGTGGRGSCNSWDLGETGGIPYLDVEIWLDSEPSFQFNLFTRLTTMRIESCFIFPVVVKRLALRWLRTKLVRPAEGSGGWARWALGSTWSPAQVKPSTGYTFRISLPRDIVDCSNTSWFSTFASGMASYSPSATEHSHKRVHTQSGGAVPFHGGPTPSSGLKPQGTQ